MRYRLPYARARQVVGLLGGSFDPPHEGHAHITREAIKRFDLDRVWWLVSPGNPLKERGPAPMDQRMNAARELMQHPKVEVTDIEVIWVAPIQQKPSRNYAGYTLACGSFG